MTELPTVVFVVGARPQFVKAAALAIHMQEHPDHAAFRPLTVHSGQHYDDALSDVFFRELPLPRPDVHLEVGPGSAMRQLGLVLERTSEVLAAEHPAAVVVFGDTTTTLGAALAAAMSDLPLVHIEAGERAYHRRGYPEELNRVLTDHAAALCLTATDRAALYLAAEGIAEKRVRVVGDVMFDLFRWAERRLGHRDQVERPGDVPPGVEYDLATIHRAENTDDPDRLRRLLEALDDGPRVVLLPAHPRLKKAADGAGWRPTGAIRMVEPFGYLDTMAALLGSTTVITDSGGLMREAFFAERPCVVPLERTPWRELVSSGWATEVADDADRLREAVRRSERPAAPPEPLFGDGQAGRWVVDAINEVVADGVTDDWEPH